MKPETISIAPKAKPPQGSWWAQPYSSRDEWYAHARAEADRLRDQKKVTPSDYGTEKFGDYWKKPRQEDIARFDDNTAQVA